MNSGNYLPVPCDYSERCLPASPSGCPGGRRLELDMRVDLSQRLSGKLEEFVLQLIELCPGVMGAHVIGMYRIEPTSITAAAHRVSEARSIHYPNTG